jgi:hypothetical protein
MTTSYATISTGDMGLSFPPFSPASADPQFNEPALFPTGSALAEKWTSEFRRLVADSASTQASSPVRDPAFETPSAFDQLQRKEQEDRAKVIKDISLLGSGGRVASRLRDLMSYTEDDYPAEPLLSLPSLKDLRTFIKCHQHEWRLPEIGVSPKGNIILEWYTDKTHHLTVEFKGDDTAKFVLWTPDIRKKEKIVPVSALASITSIDDALSPYGVWEWIRYAG